MEPFSRKSVKEEPVREGKYAKFNVLIGLPLVAIGVLIGAFGVFVNWYYAPGRTGVTDQPSPSPAPTATHEPSPTPIPPRHPSTPVDGGSPTSGGGTVASPPSPPADAPSLPLEFTLRDGEQRTFLGDQASVAAEFNQVGSENFVTLRVGTTEGGSVPHAILDTDTGARFPVRVAGSEYSVYVLSIDKAARTVGVRISRKSESP